MKMSTFKVKMNFFGSIVQQTSFTLQKMPVNLKLLTHYFFVLFSMFVAFEKAAPMILEPIMTVEIIVPQEYQVC